MRGWGEALPLGSTAGVVSSSDLGADQASGFRPSIQFHCDPRPGRGRVWTAAKPRADPVLRAERGASRGAGAPGRQRLLAQDPELPGRPAAGRPGLPLRPRRDKEVRARLQAPSPGRDAGVSRSLRGGTRRPEPACGAHGAPVHVCGGEPRDLRGAAGRGEGWCPGGSSRRRSVDHSACSWAGSAVSPGSSIDTQMLGPQACDPREVVGRVRCYRTPGCTLRLGNG